jgi:hypothetical protein
MDVVAATVMRQLNVVWGEIRVAKRADAQLHRESLLPDPK